MAATLFAMLIPHFNSYGKLNGDPRYLMSEVCPLISWLQDEVLIRQCLQEINDSTNVKWFEHDGRWYLHSLHWDRHQSLRSDRLGPDSLPSHPSWSGTAPGAVPHEGKGTGRKKKGDGQVDYFLKRVTSGSDRLPKDEDQEELFRRFAPLYGLVSDEGERWAIRQYHREYLSGTFSACLLVNALRTRGVSLENCASFLRSEDAEKVLSRTLR